MKLNCKVDDPPTFRSEPSTVTAAAVVKADSLQEIVDVIRYANEKNLGICVIGGGHSTLCVRENAVVMDLRTPAFQKVKVLDDSTEEQHDQGADNKTKRIEIGGGATLGGVCAALKGTGYCVPLGTYPSVGVGLLLQGGHGYLTRQHGLSIDFIEKAEIVDATGQVRHISKDSHPDILWALRGAGNQIGCVVTKLTLNTVQPEEMYLDRILVSRSPSQMPGFLANVLTKAIALPRKANLSFILSRAPNLTSNDYPVIFLVYSCRPTSGEEETKLDLLDELVDGANTAKGDKDDSSILWRETRGTISYNETAGLFDLPPSASTETFGDQPPFAAIFTTLIGGADFKNKISDLSRILVDRLIQAPHPNVRIDFQQTGGAVADVKPDETAFWNRKQEYSAVCACLYKAEDAGKQAEVDAYQWVGSVTETFHRPGVDVAVGTYSVDIMREEKPAAEAAANLASAYGDNWSRILKVRNECDPMACFCPQGV